MNIPKELKEKIEKIFNSNPNVKNELLAGKLEIIQNIGIVSQN